MMTKPFSGLATSARALRGDAYLAETLRILSTFSSLGMVLAPQPSSGARRGGRWHRGEKRNEKKKTPKHGTGGSGTHGFFPHLFEAVCFPPTHFEGRARQGVAARPPTPPRAPTTRWWRPGRRGHCDVSRRSRHRRPGPVSSMSRTEKLRSLLVRGPFARRPPRAIACLVETVGECASHRADRLPLWRSGMLLVVAEYVAFVALSLWGGTPAPKNVSICGYLELLPDSVFFLSRRVPAGVDCTLFHALAVFNAASRTEKHAAGVLQALSSPPARCALRASP